MEYRKLGNAGIDVPALSLGSWKTFEFMVNMLKSSMMLGSGR